MSNDAASFPTDPAIDLIRTAIPEGMPDWTENIAWTLHDETAGVSLYGHFGRMQPDRSIWEGVSLIYLPDGGRLVNRSFGVCVDQARNGEYHYKPVLPAQVWQFKFDGVAQRVDPAQLRTRPVGDEPVEAVSYDIVFSALQPVFNMHKSDITSERMHLEHAGAMRGTLTVAGKTYAIDTTGYRDHSVSRRTFTTLDTETWANCTFASGRIFSILEVSRSGRQLLEGQVWRDGKRLFAKPVEVPALHDTAGAPHAGTITVDTDEGRVSIDWELVPDRVLSWQLLRPVGLRPGIDHSDPENMVAVQSPAKFTWDGEVGYGWMERTRPLKSLRG